VTSSRIGDDDHILRAFQGIYWIYTLVVIIELPAAVPILLESPRCELQDVHDGHHSSISVLLSSLL
jgi:hypothetical protein